jgi:hypothetical protein
VTTTATTAEFRPTVCTVCGVVIVAGDVVRADAAELDVDLWDSWRHSDCADPQLALARAAEGGE